MVNSSTAISATPAVFEHRKRTDWGIAVLAWETDEKRGYLFADGEVRVVARDYYDLMCEVNRPLEEIQPLLARLASASGERAPVSSVNPIGFGFDDQLQHFLAQFPEGFDSTAWQAEHRGKGASRRLKRHRDAAVLHAQSQFAQAALDARLSEHRYAELWQDLVDVAKATDLVSAQCLAPVSTEDPAKLAELAKSLRHLLYGEGALEPRLQRYINACREASGKEPSWPLVTFVAALMFPKEHVCIQPTSFREQARWLAPRLVRQQPASVAAYRQFLEMARHVAKKLTDAQVPPGDLLDVADFIRFTTSPSARKAMLARKYEAAKAAEAGPEAA